MKPTVQNCFRHPIVLRQLDPKEWGCRWDAIIPSLGPLAFCESGNTIGKAISELRFVASALCDGYDKDIKLPDPPELPEYLK